MTHLQVTLRKDRDEGLGESLVGYRSLRLNALLNDVGDWTVRLPAAHPASRLLMGSYTSGEDLSRWGIVARWPGTTRVLLSGSATEAYLSHSGSRATSTLTWRARDVTEAIPGGRGLLAARVFTRRGAVGSASGVFSFRREVFLDQNNAGDEADLADQLAVLRQAADEELLRGAATAGITLAPTHLVGQGFGTLYGLGDRVPVSFAGTDLTLVGQCDNAVFNGALAYPSPQTDTSSSGLATFPTAHDGRSGAAESVMRGFVAANIGPGSLNTRRAYPWLVIPPDHSPALGTSDRWLARMENLLDLLARVAAPSGLGFRLVQGAPGTLTFEIWEPQFKPEAGLTVRTGAPAPPRSLTETVTRVLVEHEPGQALRVTPTIGARDEAETPELEPVVRRLARDVSVTLRQ